MPKSKKAVPAARAALLDQMAVQLSELGGHAHGQQINEAMGICQPGERSAAGDRLYLDAKEDKRFYKPAPERGKKASWKLSAQGERFVASL